MTGHQKSMHLCKAVLEQMWVAPQEEDWKKKAVSGGGRFRLDIRKAVSL